MYALVQMDASYPGRFTETIFALVLPYLPLKVDLFEEEKVVAYLMNVYETSPAMFSKHAVEALTAYGRYLDPEKEDEEYKVGLERRDET